MSRFEDASTRRFPRSLVAFAQLAAAAVPLAAQAPAQGPIFEVHEASIAELQEAMETGAVTSVQLVDAYLARIRAYDQAGPELNAVLHLNVDVHRRAAALDAERAGSGSRGPLHGIPVLLKDNFDTADMPTTAGSVALAAAYPAEDGTVARRLREAGAVILGKTNMHEMAYGYTSISSLGGQTRNPYDPTRNPGGSSGGTGAAIAASLAAIGWGSDTCGSIRVPAVSNNLYGLRPTKGLSSVHGMIPMSHTQDVQGPLARTVSDLAVGLDATVGYDPQDPATYELEDRPPSSFTDALRSNALEDARIGVLEEAFGETPEEEETTRLIHRALSRFEALGAELVELESVGLDSLVAGTSVIRLEFEADLDAYLSGHPNTPVASLTDILERGLYHEAVEGSLRRSAAVQGTDSPEYREALARRETATRTIVELLDAQRLDALAYPVVRRPPSPIGEGQGGVNCSISAGTGLPSMAVPAGLTAEGLPVGFQLLGRRFDDARLVGFAYAYEQATSARMPPPLTPTLSAEAR